MTNEQRLKALEMLLNGKSYEDVGKYFCVSTTVIWEMFHRALKDVKSTQSDESNCKYKRLIRCINEKYGNVPVAAKEIGVAHSTLLNVVKGNSDTRKSVIVAVLKATGLTFEEAFYEDFIEESEQGEN